MTSSPTTPFNILFIGAGVIHFGSPLIPWNHSKRLEQKLGSRLNVVGLIDIDIPRAQGVLDQKRQAGIPGYEHTKVFSSIPEAGQALTGDFTPAIAMLGLRPNAHGSTKPGKDAELQLIKAFPKVALFVEKPISLDTFEEVGKVAEALRKAGTITSVGYMLRYVTAVKEMKRIIKENNLTVMATIARYLMAYQFPGNEVTRLPFWDLSLSPGPIVEQATHICDLCRFFAPPVDLSSIQVLTVEHSDPVGQLSELTIEKGRIEDENRIPRMTNAIWRYENGAMGQLLHGVSLHDGEYSVELCVLADGWLLKLVEPYNEAPRLYIRQPGKVEVEFFIGQDDCYYHEISAMVDVVDGVADKSVILSTYEDAMESYKLTWEIRWRGEKTSKERIKAT